MVLGVLCACGGGSIGPNARSPQPALRQVPLRKTGPGKIVSTADGGQIYGYDVDQHGSDGILASANEVGTNIFKVSVEVFNTKTAKITKSFGVSTGSKNSYAVDGIFANDAALVTHFIVPKHSIYAKRRYEVVDPVTAGRFTGAWTPNVKDLDVLENAENQETSTSVVYAIELKNNDNPDLVVGQIGNGAKGTVIHLDPYSFSLNNSPQLSEDTVNNRAVMATSPAGGAPGSVPEIATVDLSSGKVATFEGIDCPGSENCGAANGIAYDSATGIACTTTTLDAGVEFYNVAQQSGFWAGLPVPPSGVAEFYSGTYVASDPIHKLFLVAQPNSGSAVSGSSVQVFNENGVLMESIDGLNFTFNFYLAVPVTIAIDPKTRTGWVNGPQVTQLQEFSY
jgi:hypothetical protein